LGNDKVLYHEICLDYLQDLPLKLNKKANSIKKEKMTAIEQVAHTLKGASANIGADKIKKLLFRIELASRNGETEKIIHFYSALNEEAKKIDKKIKKLTGMEV